MNLQSTESDHAAAEPEADLRPRPSRRQLRTLVHDIGELRSYDLRTTTVVAMGAGWVAAGLRARTWQATLGAVVLIGWSAARSATVVVVLHQAHTRHTVTQALRR